jgi:hypothetical protein
MELARAPPSDRKAFKNKTLPRTEKRSINIEKYWYHALLPYASIN